MGIEFTPRQRAELAARMRKEHWERHAKNKTYEQWLAEQEANNGINRVHSMMDAIEKALEL